MATMDRRSLQHFDWVLLGLMAAVLAIGLANLYSASFPGTVTGLPSEFRRQLLALGVGGVAMLVALLVDYRRLERWAIPIFIATLLLVASTLIFAPVTRGNRSWLIYGPFSLQPAELAKVGLVLALARYFHRHPPSEIRRVRDLWMPAAIAALPVGLIVLQRDMGVAVLTLLIATTYLLFVRIPARAWVGIGVAGLAALAGLWQFVFKDYQRQRILDFIDPSRDPLASG